MQEAEVLLGPNNSVIHWHTPNDRNGGALPDSRNLWDVIWENRDKVTGFAHTHPGSGSPGPSYTDTTTFAAIEAALGKHLNWPILSSDSQVLCLFDNEKGTYSRHIITVELIPNNWDWMDKLRELSHY
jgi:hypothetical protein